MPPDDKDAFRKARFQQRRFITGVPKVPGRKKSRLSVTLLNGVE
jgi:hypothetical protein